MKSNRILVPWIVVPVLAGLVWTVAFLSMGGHEYCDGLHYAANAATLSRDLHAEPQLDWEGFINHAEELGTPHPYVNHLYTLSLALVQSAFSRPEIWQGSLLSLTFALMGSAFTWMLMRRFLPIQEALLVLVVTLTSCMAWSTLARPLTDAPFFGLTSLTLWYGLQTRKALPTGLLIGLSCVFRMQGVYTFLLMPLLVCERLTLYNVVRVWFLMGLGVLPFAALYLFLASAFGPAAGQAVPSSLYMDKWIHFYSTIKPDQYFFNVNKSLGELMHLNVLSPLLIPAGAALFVRLRDKAANRLALLAFASIALIMLTTCTAGSVPTRYYLPYLPLVLLAAWLMLREHADLLPGRLRSLLPWALFLTVGLFGTATLAAQVPKMSLQNVGRPYSNAFHAVLHEFGPNQALAGNEPRLLLLSFSGRKLVQLPCAPQAFLQQSKRNQELAGLVFVLNRLQLDPSLERKPWKARQTWDGNCGPPDCWAAWEQLLSQEEIIDASGNRFHKVLDQCDWLERRVVFVRQEQE